MAAQSLQGGFSNPPHDAARAFRGVMDAMARPGTITRLAGAQPPAPLSPAAGTVLLTLCDTDTPLHLAGAADCDGVRAWLAFHTGAPLVGPDACMFALGRWEALLPLSSYPIGTPEYPDRSATLIVECASMSEEGVILRGPGIPGTTALSLPDPETFRANHALFPLGLDFLFTWEDRCAALPRSTDICAPESATEVL
jgi:alpha-D-ribose 1-methylphosphonate 5-triphosphate synthase subunit PhnH